MKAVVAAFNQEKALVGAFSVITNLRMELFEALPGVDHDVGLGAVPGDVGGGVALGVEEGGVERLEAGGAVQEGLLPLAVVLDGGVAALYAPLELAPALVTLGQQ